MSEESSPLNADRRSAAPLACARCRTPFSPGAKFCSGCGTRLASTPQLECRPLTVLFCDLVDSTAMVAGADPEDSRTLLTTFHSAVTVAMREVGGHVARFIGDAALVYFGYPEAHEDDAERAINAALEASTQVRALKDPQGRALQSRIGIATGLVVIGNLHEEMTADVLDVAGEAPHLAARLQAAAEPDAILVDMATRQRVGDLFSWRDLGGLSLKGFDKPIHAWAVTGARPAASRFEAQHENRLLPMLGRDDLRDAILGHWRQACEGWGRSILIRGEPGVGKSRMAAAILEATSARTTLRYFCSQYRLGSTLHPCVQQLEWAAGFARDDPNEVKLDKLSAAIGEVPEEDRDLLAELVNVTPAVRASAPALTPQAKRRRTMEALLSQLERLAAKEPTLVIFEDAQWSDESTLELLGLAATRVHRLPVLMLILARPEFSPAWLRNKHLVEVSLTPLDPLVGSQLVRMLAADTTLSAQTVNDIVARTDGIPLYIEEVTKAVVENRQRQPLASQATAGSLPISLQASLLSRLDRLGQSREVAEIAAAIGRTFNVELLALVFNRSDALKPSLDALVAAGIFQRLSGKDSEYAFRHALIRDAAYRIMVRERRQAIQLRIVSAIESKFPEMRNVQPEVLAWHCAEGGLAREAAQYWLMAGVAALRRSAMHEALVHLRSGIKVLPAETDEAWRAKLELDLTIALGKALIATQGYAIASTGETFTRARVLCDRLGNPPQLLAVLHGLWTHALLRGELASAQSQADALLAQGQNSGDRMHLLMGHRFSGITSHPRGEFFEAVRQLEEGLSLYDPAQQATYWALTVDDPRVIMLTYLSWSQMCLGRITDARQNSERAINEAREMHHAYTLAHALTGASFVTLTIDRPEAALQRLDDLRALLEDNGISYYDAVETVLRGWCLAAVGRFDESHALLERGIPAYRSTDARLYLSGFLRLAAEAYGWAGKIDLALQLITESLSVLEATNQRWDEAETHRVHGTLLKAAGDKEGARCEFAKALEIARHQKARLWELRTACDLVELDDSAVGSNKVAMEVLAAALEISEAYANTPDLLRAQTLLSRRH